MNNVGAGSANVELIRNQVATLSRYMHELSVQGIAEDIELAITGSENIYTIHVGSTSWAINVPEISEEVRRARVGEGTGRKLLTMA